MLKAMKVQLLEGRSGFSMKLQASLDTPSLTPKTWLDRSLMQARIPVLEAQVSSTVKFAALAAQIGVPLYAWRILESRVIASTHALSFNC